MRSEPGSVEERTANKPTAGANTAVADFVKRCNLCGKPVGGARGLGPENLYQHQVVCARRLGLSEPAPPQSALGYQTGSDWTGRAQAQATSRSCSRARDYDVGYHPRAKILKADTEAAEVLALLAGGGGER